MIWHRGEHTPMITKDEFDRIQILLGRNGRPRPKTHDFPLTGIIRCGECKAMITCEEKWQLICSSCKHKFASQNKDACPKCQTRIEEMVKPTIVHHIYYHCTKKIDPNCTQRSINADELETQVDTLLGRINISDAFKDWALKYLGELNKREVSTRNASIASVRLAYDDCIKRLDNLTKLKISPQNSDNSLLSDEEFKQEKQKLLKEKSDIEQKMANIGYRITNWLETAEKAFNFAVHARVWFADGTPQEKREIVATIGSNLLLRDKKLLFDLEKPYCFIEDMVAAEPTILHTSEPKEKIANTSELEASWAKNPHLLAYWNDYRHANWQQASLYSDQVNELNAIYAS